VSYYLALCWILLPIASFGFLTVPCLLFAAIRLRSRSLALWTAGSAVLLLGYFALSNPNSSSWQENVASCLLVLLLGIGAGKLAQTRPLLFPSRAL